MAKVDKILPKLSQTGGFVGLALTKCVSLLTNCLLRQIWVCGYSNADFDLITVVAQNPYLSVENALFLVHLLSLVCIEDSIYTSVAFVPLSVLITRFKAEPRMYSFVVEYLRTSVVALAGVEAAIAEEGAQLTVSFAAKKTREVRVSLVTNTLERILRLHCMIYNEPLTKILSFSLSEFQNIYLQKPSALSHLLSFAQQHVNTNFEVVT